MNRGNDWRDAAASATASTVRLARHCESCGMPKGSGLGDHYLGCPALDAAATTERAS